MSMTREEKLKSLKALVRFFSDNPDLDLPYIDGNYFVFHGTKFELAETISKLRKAGIEFVKWYDSSSAGVEVEVGQFKIRWVCGREKVCLPKKVERVTIPAKEAYTYERVVEWECGPMLGAEEEVSEMLEGME